MFAMLAPAARLAPFRPVPAAARAARSPAAACTRPAVLAAACRCQCSNDRSGNSAGVQRRELLLAAVAAVATLVALQRPAAAAGEALPKGEVTV